MYTNYRSGKGGGRREEGGGEEGRREERGGREDGGVQFPERNITASGQRAACGECHSADIPPAMRATALSHSGRYLAPSCEFRSQRSLPTRPYLALSPISRSNGNLPTMNRYGQDLSRHDNIPFKMK
ncbi:hypothetical protein EYF80_004992 [Liparis tanakae]|uniref:Uncharacterized protein n=1 Tax=Liparis tanakae TaxID=230148 RepID=A0A4Z2J4K1_9TELE|nr:hypothetical protein EYF80_004992 [Liparis tanakae]